ncbi:hypothetical protein [Streptosporangium sandarakinum]|uniref:hypothetical protein n=1 Tax=Streptosporangium sandarakinum TaxID=1260955 RepID=UPI00343B76E2
MAGLTGPADASRSPSRYALTTASEVPCPAGSDTAPQASPSSVTRPRLHRGISIWATWS